MQHDPHVPRDRKPARECPCKRGRGEGGAERSGGHFHAAQRSAQQQHRERGDAGGEIVPPSPASTAIRAAYRVAASSLATPRREPTLTPRCGTQWALPRYGQPRGHQQALRRCGVPPPGGLQNSHMKSPPTRGSTLGWARDAHTTAAHPPSTRRVGNVLPAAQHLPPYPPPPALHTCANLPGCRLFPHCRCAAPAAG
jgi:hypothetical protein